MDHYLEAYREFSDIQDSYPMPLEVLERGTADATH
jgi:hypothetical protein